ncbi:DMT family transporter [Pseudomonas segetis]|uniref:EamA-like transporter family protein n=1 Tax=Pseudomonas segetis TaxID=298908 RepID=A0A239GVC8_9PSED|nr:DMT family transporter [Pseudomonas segetis]SNS72931.1 EamA-like transporter family protein [Pseudomonas segetis]
MSSRTLLLTALAMLAFAGNSIVCRLALKTTEIDAASFTSVRLVAGAITLLVILRLKTAAQPLSGTWSGALALTTYAIAFSFAYLNLDAGSGALLLFGAVQLSMIAWGFYRGERFSFATTFGLAMALAGLLALLLPGANTPALGSALLMLLAGVAWGVYSLMGRGATDPLATTAGNFLRAVPIGLIISAVFISRLQWDLAGLGYAVLSGAVTSGVGYAIWYSALRGLKSFQAATVQLSVPILTALAGSLLLGEALNLRLLLSSAAVLGGIAIVLQSKQRNTQN